MQLCMLASLCILVARKFYTPVIFFLFFFLFVPILFSRIRLGELFITEMTDDLFRFYLLNVCVKSMHSLISRHLWAVYYRDARVMWDQKTGRSRGFGFVSFRNQQAWLESSVLHLLSFCLWLFLCASHTNGWLTCFVCNLSGSPKCHKRVNW